MFRKNIFLELLNDPRPILIVGQTGSGKTTLIKKLLNKYSMPFIVFDYNDEYDFPVLREIQIKSSEFNAVLPIFLSILLDKTIPQQLLYLVIKNPGDLEKYISLGLYDRRVLNALKLRLDSFKELIENNNTYNIPIVKMTIPPILRIPYTALIISHRLLLKNREIIVLEETQSLNLQYIAEEGRKANKKYVFITNNIDSVDTGIINNSIILLFRCLPRVKYQLGFTEKHIQPNKLDFGEFYILNLTTKIYKKSIKIK